MLLYENVSLGIATEESPIGFVEKPIESLMESTLDGLDGSKAVAVYKVPVSRCDVKNGNGRVYSRALWENILATQKDRYIGSIGFSNHPQNREDMKDMCVVWGSGEIDANGIVWFDMYLIGEQGETYNQAIQVGAKIGISSVGDGDCDAMGNVIVDSFKILRPGDIVYNPSQGVFAEKNQFKENLESEVWEENPLNEEACDNEKVKEDSTIDKLKEALECEEDEIYGKVVKMKEFILNHFE